MTGIDDVLDDLDRWADGRDLTVLAVLGIAALALVLRFVLLGDRIAHWDEGRVAYWTLDYLRTGEFHYRFIIHGPFVQIVNRPVFAALGPTDFSARAIVAVIGGLLPVSALLLREHLRDVETVIVAGLLAANPILLYYSRFFRSSVPVAAFMFVAFGLFVRAYDTRRPRYVHAGVAFVALGFTAKENAAVYLLVWAGALVLLLDHELFLPRAVETGFDRLRALAGRVRARRDDWRSAGSRLALHAAVAAALFALVIAFFYAPRTSDPAGVGLWQAVAHPGRFPALVDAMAADIVEGYTYWFGGATDAGCNQSNVIDGYLCFLGRSLLVLASYGAVVVPFALLGFFAERYGAERPRRLVTFTSYWGFVSLVGYPLGADIFGAWFLVNVIVPLTVPAAVGLGIVVRWGEEALEDGDQVSAWIAAAFAALVVAQLVFAGATGVYASPQDPENRLVQFAQPGGDFRAELQAIERASGSTSGPDVVLYGEWLVDGDAEAERHPPCADWFNALPLPWYFAANDWTVECANNASELDRLLDQEPTAVIVRTGDVHDLPETLGASDPFAGYTGESYAIRASVDPPATEITIYLREDVASTA
ncbi:MAG: TIGR03663 family protein [Halobacteriales archaeon]|nr:TIGR03663 family protein [Halobacteriales archaeon]